MKNTFGNNVTFTIFGESHGEEIGAVIDGMTPGVTVDEEYIASRLALRRPSGRISTARVEEDKFRIVSGVFNGRATGTPITILIPNRELLRDRDMRITQLILNITDLRITGAAVISADASQQVSWLQVPLRKQLLQKRV